MRGYLLESTIRQSLVRHVEILNRSDYPARYRARDFLDIRADLFREICDLVDKGDLRGQECIRCVLDELRGTAACEHDRCLVEVQRPVDFRNNLAGSLVIRTDDNAVRHFEIADCGTFAKEFSNSRRQRRRPLNLSRE